MLTTVLLLIAISTCFLSFRFYKTINSLYDRYGRVIEVDEAVTKANVQLTTVQGQLRDLSGQYHAAKTQHEALQRDIAILEEHIEDLSYGLYKPHFNFQTSAEYKDRMEQVYDQARQMIRSDEAAICSVQWEVGGSQKNGAKMAKQSKKLILRAFNGECDAAAAKVSWNNITKMEERVMKAFESINALGSMLHVSIAERYLHLKLDELRLTYEYEEKRRSEQEAQRRIQAEMREEEKARRELEKAREDSEAQELMYQRALDKAHLDASQASDKEMGQLADKIAILESQLEEAKRKKERAISQAQLTKSGHVYIISNTGSFGQYVYKIGMTRRLEPMDRIEELGDASVPFPFDVHAMIYSDNAPALEAELHAHFDSDRINLVNQRKEFFAVSLEDIERFIAKRGLTIEIVKQPEAKEYRETIAMRTSQCDHRQPSIPSMERSAQYS